MQRPSLDEIFKSPIQQDDIDTDEVKIKVRRGAKGETGERGPIGPVGPRGPRGADGDAPTKDEIVSLIKPLIPKPLKGKDGETPSLAVLVPLIESLIPEPIPGKDGINGETPTIDITPKEIIEKINKSRGEKIKRSKIEGMDDLEGRFKGLGNQVQNIVSLGGSRRTNIQFNGVNIGQVDTIDFLNGTVAVPIGNDGSTITYTAPSSGGGGSGYQQPLSGGLTGTNTWTTAPNVIVVDGTSYQKTATDGTVNWTVSGTGPYTTVLTTTVPNGDIFASA